MPDLTDLLPSIAGPHNPGQTRQMAVLLPAVARWLNHATGSHAAQALHEPADVDKVVTELTAMAERLPQLLEQLGGWLEEERDAGELEVRHGPWKGNPDEAVMQVQSWLSGAIDRAGELYTELDGARQVTVTIGGVPGVTDGD